MVEPRRDFTETLERTDAPKGAGRFKPPGRWRLIRLLGRGGQAEVWLAEDRELRQRVALKLFHHLGGDPTARERMRREVRLGRELQHRGVVRIYDLVELDDALMAVMEWVPGGSLAQLVSERGTLPVDRVLEVAQQVLEALAYLHANGIIHRDLKPSNLLVGEDGRVLIADLGLARPLAATGLTRTRTVVGTPAYMAPEQLLGEEVTPATDLYALGVTLFELLTGAPPFHATSEFGMADAVLHARPPALRSRRPDCPAWLASFVHRLLERAPEDRFADAGEALAAFERRRAVHSPRRLRRGAAWLAATVLILAGVAAGRRLASAPPPLHEVRRAGNELVAYDARGNELWRRRTDSRAQFVVADLLGSPDPEVAVERRPRHRDDRVVLDILGHRGRRVASMTLFQSAQLPGLKTSPNWALSSLAVGDVDGDGHDDLLWSVVHCTWFPSAAGVWAPRSGRASASVLVNSGHIRRVFAADLDGDGTRELVISGVNNPMGFQRMIVLASYRAVWAGDEYQPLRSPDLEADAAGGFYSRGDELYSFVVLGSGMNGSNIVHADPSGIVLQKGEHRLRLDPFGNPEGSPLYGRGWRERRRFWMQLATLCRKIRLASGGQALELWSRFAGEHTAVLAERPSEAAAVLLAARSMADAGHHAAAWHLLEETANRIHGERDLYLRAGEYHLIAGDRAGGRTDIIRSLPIGPGGRNAFDPFLLLGLDAVVHGDEGALEDAIRKNSVVSQGTGNPNFVHRLRPALLWAQGRWDDPRLVHVQEAPELPVLTVVERWAAMERGEDPAHTLAQAAVLERNPDMAPLAQLLHAAAALRLGDTPTARAQVEEALYLIERKGLRSYETYCWHPLACWLAAAATGGEKSPHLEEWLRTAAAAGPATWYGRRAAAALAGMHGAP